MFGKILTQYLPKYCLTLVFTLLAATCFGLLGNGLRSYLFFVCFNLVTAFCLEYLVNSVNIKEPRIYNGAKAVVGCVVLLCSALVLFYLQ